MKTCCAMNKMNRVKQSIVRIGNFMSKPEISLPLIALFLVVKNDKK